MVTVSPITLGNTLKRAEIAGFVLTESEHPPGLSLPAHAHRHAGLAIVLDGAFTETFPATSVQAEPWSLVVRPAERVHSDRISPAGCRTLVIEILPGRADRLATIAPFFQNETIIAGAAVAGSAKRLYAEFRSGSHFSELACEGLLLELLALAARQGSGEPASGEPHWMVRARGLIRERFRGNLGLSDVARAVDVHPVHLARTFREHFGSTVGEYIRRLRIDYAADHLANSAWSLGQIADAAGFSDQSHFCRLFRRHTGMTPSQFRKARRA